MSKYLDFDIAIRKLGTWYNDLAEANGSDDDFVKGYGNAMDDLADVPAADVQEVKHGKWIYKGRNPVMSHVFECSVCERWICANSVDHVVEEYPFCHCGAKIDGVEELEEEK